MNTSDTQHQHSPSNYNFDIENDNKETRSFTGEQEELFEKLYGPNWVE